MALIDLAIILAFIAYAVWAGLRSRRQASANLEEYFLAGRSLPGWKAGISMAATQFAADTPLLVTGLIATAGIFSLWRMWIYALAFLLLGFLLAACWRRARVITDAELSEIRYGAKPAAVLRGFKAIYFGTIFNCTVLAWVLLAASHIAEPFLLWHQWLPAGVFLPLQAAVEALGVPVTVHLESPQVWTLTTNNIISILLIVTVTTLYSATGGLRSVVDTDVAQFLLMMVGTGMFAWVVIDHLGGLSAIPTELAALEQAGRLPGGIEASQVLAFDFWNAKDFSLAFLAVLALQWLVQLNADGTGYLAQRSMACRSDRDARQAAIVFTVAQVLVRSLFWLPLAIGLLIIFPPASADLNQAVVAQREATYVRGMAELLPPGLMGLMLTAMLAALASTVDTHLNWGSSYWTNDIYKRFFCRHVLRREPSPRSLIWVARLANILILLIALVIMANLSSIQQAWQTSLLLGAGMGVMLILRWLWWRITAAGEIACIVASLLLAPLLLLYVDDEAARLLIMAVLASAAGVITSLAFGGEDRQRLQAFYDRVKPPGFWGPFAPRRNDDRRRLGRALLATALCAVSIFCVLTAVGSWLVSSPAPPWFPWRWLYLLLLAAIGSALVPVWWRLGFATAAPEVQEPAATAVR
jgi:solute:Na+ symporter, SSS family